MQYPTVRFIPVMIYFWITYFEMAIWGQLWVRELKYLIHQPWQGEHGSQEGQLLLDHFREEDHHMPVQEEKKYHLSNNWHQHICTRRGITLDVVKSTSRADGEGASNSYINTLALQGGDIFVSMYLALWWPKKKMQGITGQSVSVRNWDFKQKFL